MRLLTKISLIILLFGFTVLNSKADYEDLDVAGLYKVAFYELKTGNASEAIKYLKRIGSEFSYQTEAIEAQLLLIWIYYQQNDLLAAEVEIESFNRYYPYNKYSVWIDYMKSLVYFEQIGDIKRDQGITQKALIAFNALLKKYPDSEYSKSIIFKIEVVKDLLATKNMDIGKYYLKQKEYISAIARFQEIVDNFQTTSAIDEAMYRLTQAWLALGVEEEAFKTAAVLGYNYPDSIWYKKTYQLIKKYSNITRLEE